MNKGYDLVLGVVLIAVNSGILFGLPDKIPGVYLSLPLLLPLLPAPYLSIYLSPWWPYCTNIQLTHGAWPLCSAPMILPFLSSSTAQGLTEVSRWCKCWDHSGDASFYPNLPVLMAGWFTQTSLLYQLQYFLFLFVPGFLTIWSIPANLKTSFLFIKSTRHKNVTVVLSTRVVLKESLRAKRIMWDILINHVN